MKLWNYIDGKLLDSSDCSVFSLKAKVPDVSVSKNDPVSIVDDSTKGALAVRSIANIGRSFAVILERFVSSFRLCVIFYYFHINSLYRLLDRL